MTTQLDLFPAIRPITHTDPTVPKQARPRLGGQNRKVLDRLMAGPAMNTELEECSGSHRINSRVADCRKYLEKWEGKTILCAAIDAREGLYRYGVTDLPPDAPTTPTPVFEAMGLE